MISLIGPWHRSMGENLEEVEEFDRIMQSVAEGTYHPSHSAMETFPVKIINCYDITCVIICTVNHEYFVVKIFSDSLAYAKNKYVKILYAKLMIMRYRVIIC